MSASPHHQRIQAVFEGRWADRVPICEQAFASSVASRILGREAVTGSSDVHYFQARAWFQSDQAHAEFLDRLYRDALELCRRLDLDIFHPPWRLGMRPTQQVDEYTLIYGSEQAGDWRMYRYDPVTRTYGHVRSARPAADLDDVLAQMRRAVDAWQGPPQPQLDVLMLRAIREIGSERVVAGSSGIAVPIEPGYLAATAVDPGLVAAWVDMQVENNLAMLDEQARVGIRLINGGGDFAFNSGPVYSPRFFEEVMAPRWKRLFDRARQLGMWYVMRSDGNLWPVAQALFGWAHPDAYYECDYDAGMRFGPLREAFPELVLMGNLSCDLLHQAAPEQIRRRVIECIQAAGPRVVISSANAILHGTPPENVLAMYETAKSYPVPGKP